MRKRGGGHVHFMLKNSWFSVEQLKWTGSNFIKFNQTFLSEIATKCNTKAVMLHGMSYVRLLTG